MGKIYQSLINKLELVFRTETNYQLKSGVNPDNTSYIINIPKIGRIYNVNGLTGDQYYYVYPIKPGKKWKHLQEGDLVSFSNSPGDCGQILLISKEMNLILIQIGLDRTRQTRFQLNRFAEDNIKVLIRAQGLLHFFNQ